MSQEKVLPMSQVSFVANVPESFICCQRIRRFVPLKNEDKQSSPEPGPHLFGLEMYLFRQAVETTT